jgi:hypothetical protein
LVVARRSVSATFDDRLVNGRAARTFVDDTLAEWGEERLRDDMVMCAAELATNAILHGRGPFAVTVSQTGAGIRVEVRDGNAAVLPVAIHAVGAAADVVETSTTGRGLRLVASVAARWGIDVQGDSKSVWAEVEPGASLEPTEPEITAPPPLIGESGSVHLGGLPVHTAVASGMQVDELVREIQLGLFDQAATDEERASFADLLQRSAPARLSGRRLALAAAGAGADRFDMDIDVTAGMLDAVAAFGELVEKLPARNPTTNAEPTAAVIAFRTWLIEEVLAQLAGQAPTPCPLPPS